MPKQDACHISAGKCTWSEAYYYYYFFFLHRQGGGLQLARSSLPSGDTSSHDVTLPIAISACLRGVRHASRRAPLARNSCREVPSEVTRTLNLRGFPCRPALAYRPEDLLRALCEQNTRRAARGALHTRSHGDPSVPNSNNTRPHFRRPRDWLVSDVERFRAGSQRRVRAGRARSAPRTSYMPLREPGTIAKLTLCGLFSSLLVSPV